MIRWLLVFTAILLVHISSFASPYDKWWNEGNRCYNQKQYDSAAYYFEQIAALKPADAAVYYNLGNTYYRLNKIGPAVLNYERALQIEPSHQLAKDNLTLTISRIEKPIATVEDIFFVRWWKSITAESTTTTWSVLSLLLFITVICIATLKVLGIIKFIPRQVQPALIALWAVTLILAIASTTHTLKLKAVVMTDGTQLMNNSKQGKSIGNIPEGTTVEINNETGALTEITLPDGRSGFVEKNSLTKI